MYNSAPVQQNVNVVVCPLLFCFQLNYADNGQRCYHTLWLSLKASIIERSCIYIFSRLIYPKWLSDLLLVILLWDSYRLNTFGIINPWTWLTLKSDKNLNNHQPPHNYHWNHPHKKTRVITILLYVTALVFLQNDYLRYIYVCINTSNT